MTSRPDLVRFCILTTARSGSNFLCALLDGIPGVRCHRELFHPVKPFAKEVGVTASSADRDRDPLGFLAQVEEGTLARWPETNAVGFKLFLAHNRTVLEHVASDPRYRVVVLDRENKLAQWSSRLIARQVGSWRTLPGETAPRPEITFERAEFEKFVRANTGAFQAVTQLLERHAQPFFALDYWDIKNEEVVSRLLDFLGVTFDGSLEEAMGRVRLQKQNSSRISERFANSEQVVEAMKELERSEWLDEQVSSVRRRRAARIPPVDDVADSCLAVLLSASAPLRPAAGAALSSEVNRAYQDLIAHMRTSPAPLKMKLERALTKALDAVSAPSVAAFLLQGALIRAIASNPRHWDPPGTTPGAGLFTRLDSALEAKRGRGSPYEGLGEGMRCFLGGDDDGAFEHFSAARAHPLMPIVRDDFRGAFTCRAFPSAEDLRGAGFPERRGPMEWLSDALPPSSEQVISYWCDDLYFRTFAPNIVRSLPDATTGLDLHFHVVNPGETAHELFETLPRVASRKGARLHLSAETTEVDDRAYFASVRYLRAAEALERFGRPLLLLDVDTEFHGDPGAWCRGFDRDRVNLALKRGPIAFLPWRAVWAGMLFVPSSPRGVEFAATLRDVLGYLWAGTAPRKWWIDQTALWVAYRFLERQWGAEAFVGISAEQRTTCFRASGVKHRLFAEVEAVREGMAEGKSFADSVRPLQLRRP